MPEPHAKKTGAAPVSAPRKTGAAPVSGADRAGYTVLARRYRSRDFDEIVGQEPISRTLRNAIESGRVAHAYLFCGTRGVGKTSMARIFARALNVRGDLAEADAIAGAIMRGDDLDVIEIDGASNRGIQEARDLIAGAGLSPTRCPYKIYIIDEVHMLTREAFNALLKTMEEPPAHVKFILCTTDPSKVPATIQSRCQRFDFRAIPTRLIAGQLDTILASEGIAAEPEVVQRVARLGNGSMRDALSLLDRLIASGESHLRLADAEQVLGLPDHGVAGAIVEAIVERAPALALERGNELLARGSSVEQALELLAEEFRTLLIVVTCGAESDLLELSTEARERARTVATFYDAPTLVYLIALCDAAARNSKGSTAARAIFDAVLVRLATSEHLADPARVAAELPAPSAQRTAPSRAPAVAPPQKKSDRPEREPPAAAHRPELIEPKSLEAKAIETKALEPESAEASSSEADASEPAPGVAPDEAPDALWAQVVEMAGSRSHDHGMVEHMVFRSFDGHTLRLSLDERAGARGVFMQTQTDALAALIERTTGRRVRVRIDAPEKRQAPPRAPGRQAELDEARRLPLVKCAAELFDAVVIDVEGLDGTKAPEGSPNV